MSWWPVLPMLVPFAAAVLQLALWRHRVAHRVLSVVGAGGACLASAGLVATVWRDGVTVLHVGGWRAPIGITFASDVFAAGMTLAAMTVGLAVTLYALGSIDARRERHGFHPLLMCLLMGVGGALNTADLFNLYVWFEVILISSFVLLALGGERRQIAGAMKYVVLNLLASAMFLGATGALYGMVGTLNLADLAQRLREGPVPAGVPAAGMLLLTAFGIKSALFPLFFWLPDAYPAPPTAVTALFGGLLTKVGVAALARTFSLLFGAEPGAMPTVLLTVGALSMVVGVLAAVGQTDMRRLLSFHIVSQIGYMVFALGLFSAAGYAAVFAFTIHNMLVKAALFLACGTAARLGRSNRLDRLGDLATASPVLAGAFLVLGLALAGIPPLSGFFAKFAVASAGFSGGQPWLAGLSLAVGLLTLFSMMKIWNEAFWKPRPEEARENAVVPAVEWRYRQAPTVGLAVIALAMGLLSGPVFAAAERAGEQMANPAEYVRAVLREGP